MESINSKTLGHDDTSGFEFVKEALGENVTAAVNFDRLQKHPEKHLKVIRSLQQLFKLKIWSGFKRIVLCSKVLLSNLI